MPWIEIIREWMSKRSVSAAELSRAADVRQDHLCRVLSGERKPSLGLCERIAKALIMDDHGRARLYESIVARASTSEPVEG